MKLGICSPNGFPLKPSSPRDGVTGEVAGVGRRPGLRREASLGAVPGSQDSWGRRGLSRRSSETQHACLLTFPAATLATDTRGMAWLSWDVRKSRCSRGTPGLVLSAATLGRTRGVVTSAEAGRGLKATKAQLALSWQLYQV